MSSLKCSALHLNKHFPRAILHGSLLLGGMGIPTNQQKATHDRINYFLFNIRCESDITPKLKASIIFTQLEVGTFQQFFSIPFEQFGPLATHTIGVQIWKETSVFGRSFNPEVIPPEKWAVFLYQPYHQKLMDTSTYWYTTQQTLAQSSPMIVIHPKTGTSHSFL
jgi:hypothetical protein